MPDTPDVVLGQGSLGTALATLLALQDRPVTVVSRRVDEAAEVDLTLVGRTNRYRASVTLAPEPPDELRLAVVATRADEALERARAVEDRLAGDGAIVPVQNGLTPLRIADQLDTGQVAPAVVGFNAHLRDDRTARITSPGDVTVGPMTRHAEEGARALQEAGGPIRVRGTDNPRGAVWSKWCVSCAINGLAVVTGEGVGAVTSERPGREALLSVVTECVDLAKAAEVTTERVAGPLKPDALAGNATSGLGGAFRRGLVWLIGRRYRDVTPSSIDALEAGRDPEIDALNGQAVRLGEDLGRPTPWNRAVLEAAQAVLRDELEPSLDRLEAVREQAEAGARVGQG